MKLLQGDHIASQIVNTGLKLGDVVTVDGKRYYVGTGDKCKLCLVSYFDNRSY